VEFNFIIQKIANKNHRNYYQNRNHHIKIKIIISRKITSFQ